VTSTVYIVARGAELDVFADADLAQEWAFCIGGTVREEHILTRETLTAMRQAKDELARTYR
jgi:hypothetical protein